MNVYNDGNIVLQKARLSPNNLLKITGVPLESSDEALSILNSLKTAYVNTTTYANVATNGKQFLLWDRRLGHLGASTLIKTAQLVKKLDLKGATTMNTCNTCVVANAK